MASKFTNYLALLLALNLVFFSLVSACGDCEGGNPNPHPRPRPGPKPSTPGGYQGGSPSTGGSSGSHGTGGYPSIPGTGGSSGTCSFDTLNLKVCANVLGDLLGIHLGTPANSHCCPLIKGLVNLDATVCLCTALKANILGINLNVPLSLSLLLNHCGCQVPHDFQCP